MSTFPLVVMGTAVLVALVGDFLRERKRKALAAHVALSAEGGIAMPDKHQAAYVNPGAAQCAAVEKMVPLESGYGKSGYWLCHNQIMFVPKASQRIARRKVRGRFRPFRAKRGRVRQGQRCGSGQRRTCLCGRGAARRRRDPGPAGKSSHGTRQHQHRGWGVYLPAPIHLDGNDTIYVADSCNWCIPFFQYPKDGGSKGDQ